MTLIAHLKAGIATYNAGEYHAAHDAWEDHWLELETDTDDERFLHGLIQFTAAIYHATNANWDGAQGLATSALEYLDGLPDPYRAVPLEPIESYLDRLAEDPTVIEHTDPPKLQYDDTALTYIDLTRDELYIVARVLADEYAYDESVIDEAIAFADRTKREHATTPFSALLVDFVTEPQHRDVIFRRLDAHVTRFRSRTDPIDDLFDGA